MITTVLHSKGVSAIRPPLVTKVNFLMVDLREVFTLSDLLHLEVLRFQYYLDYLESELELESTDIDPDPLRIHNGIRSTTGIESIFRASTTIT